MSAAPAHSLQGKLPVYHTLELPDQSSMICTPANLPANSKSPRYRQSSVKLQAPALPCVESQPTPPATYPTVSPLLRCPLVFHMIPATRPGPPVSVSHRSLLISAQSYCYCYCYCYCTVNPASYHRQAQPSRKGFSPGRALLCFVCSTFLAVPSAVPRGYHIG